MGLIRQPFDCRHPQLRGVELGPGSKPIENRVADGVIDGEQLTAAARLARARSNIRAVAESVVRAH